VEPVVGLKGLLRGRLLMEERCCLCGDLTGRAGVADDSIYLLDGDLGPLCEDCVERLRQHFKDEE